MKPLKVVFDTNIYVSAIIFGGNPRQCLEFARSREVELFVSRPILLELMEKLREKFLWQEDDVEEVIEGLSVFATVVTPKKRLTLIKEDPEDNTILECGLEANADYIVSGDKKHLLSIGTFRNIPIVSAKQFLDTFYGKQ